MQTPHRWVSTQGTRPDRRQKQLLGPKSVERAKSQWARSGAQIRVAPATPDNSLTNRTARRSQAGRGLPEAEDAGRLAEPDRFEEPEVSVTLGARKPGNTMGPGAIRLRAIPWEMIPWARVQAAVPDTQGWEGC